MIKKTFSTLKKNPIIILWFFIPSILSLIMLLLDKVGAISIVPFSLELFDGETQLSFSIYLYWTLNVIFNLAWLFSLLPAMLYNIYEITDGKAGKGWYKRSLYDHWWRSFGIKLIMAVFFLVVKFVLFIISKILSLFDWYSYVIIFIGGIIFIALAAAGLAFFWMGTAAVFAEEHFDEGLKNIWKASLNNMFRIFWFILFISIVAIPIYYGVDKLEKTSNVGLMVLVLSGIYAVLCGFMYTYFTHCYLDYKDHEEQKNDLLNIVNLEAKEN